MSLDDKREDVIQNTNILGTVLHEIEREEKQRKREKIRILPKVYASDLDMLKPEDGKMLYSELAKTLYLNNKDPKTYNLEYFSKYFNIEPQELRAIFNYVGFPLVDEGTGEVTRVFRFIY